jgi:dipeptidyl aminopeptidase/acylaminoacyl peptidase
MSDIENNGWNLETQIHYPLINETALSPDGKRIVYTVREPLMTEERSEFINHLYLVDVDTGESIQLTYGEHNNTLPRWSPDGEYLAFVSTRKEKANLFVIRVRGGEAWALTDNEKYGITGLEWAPDGGSLAFLMPKLPTEEEEKKKKAKDDAYLWHEEFDYQHLYRIPFRVGSKVKEETTQLTDGKYNVNTFDWLPRGEQIAITHQPRPLAEDWTKSRLALLPSNPEESLGPEDLEDIDLISTWQGSVKASPDGRWIACPVSDQPPRWAFSNRIFLYPPEGVGPQPLARTPDSQSNLIGWTGDGKAVIVQEMEGVSTQLWKLPVDGGPGERIPVSSTVKKAFSTNKGGKVAFAAEDFDMINTVSILEDSERMIVEPDLPDDWPSTPLPRTKVIRWRSEDGMEVEGIIYYPIDYQEGERYPLVVEVHGGPTGVYGRNYCGAALRYGNTAVLTQKGFVMLRANPRGSSGYGREFRFSNYDDWGGGDYRDIMTGVDYLIDDGVVDPDRMGILGWSYGGFMTSWVIANTDRFRAACVGAGVTNLMSFNGTSDIPSFIPDYFHTEFWNNLEPYRNHSALFHIKGATTPTLIQHGEKDDRVPVSQGQELYNALKKQGVPTQMVIYPRQPHGVQEPRLLMDVRRRAVDWFKRWILEPETE